MQRPWGRSMFGVFLEQHRESMYGQRAVGKGKNGMRELQEGNQELEHGFGFGSK